MEKCIFCNSESYFKNVHSHWANCKEYKKHQEKIYVKVTKTFLEEEYLKNGKSLQFIAKELGLPKTRFLEKKLKEFNIQKRTSKESKQQAHRSSLIKDTNIKRYGIGNVLKLQEFKDKVKKTNIDRYGTEYTQEFCRKQKNAMMKKYGVDNCSKIPDIIEKKKNTCLKKYGCENQWSNQEIINKCRKTKIKNGTHSGFYSKSSQVFFKKIYDVLPPILKKNCYFKELNKEFGKYDKKNNKYYYYDFVITSINYCLEYNGNYYHANPKIYKEDYFNTNLKMTSKEIWNKDKLKNDFLREKGYKVDVIWENTENENINKIITLIMNIYDKTLNNI